jgi:Zn-finger nucleic acid-binding protein
VRCPVCKDPMIIVEYQRIELDYCTTCLGVWFDAGEMELLTEHLSLDEETLSLHEIWALPDAKVAEQPRKCQMCGKKMRKVYVGEEPKVLLDICPNRHGIWFDSGEVSQVLGQLKGKDLAKEKHGRVINFLGVVFKAK